MSAGAEETLHPRGIWLVFAAQELTGQLPADYPLMPGEKRPCVRRRVGATFSLNRESVQTEGKDPELLSLEAKLALQMRILEAARKLCLEEHLSRSVKKSRLQQSKREERKLKELQRALSLRRDIFSYPVAKPSGPDTLDNPLSDSALQEEVEDQATQVFSEHLCSEDPPEHLQHHPQDPPSDILEGPRPTQRCRVEYERCPVPNSPWKESSLDQPYRKPTKAQSTNSSCSSSPVVTPRSPPLDLQLGDALPPLLHAQTLGHSQASSAPCTPELPQRRPHFQSFRLPRYQTPDTSENRPTGQPTCRRPCDLSMTPPEYLALMTGFGKLRYASSSEDSSSEHSVSSHTSSPGRNSPSEMTRSCPPPYGYYIAHHSGSNGTRRQFSPHESRLHRGPPNSSSHVSSYPHNRQHTGHPKGPQPQSGSSFCKPSQVQHPTSCNRAPMGQELPYPPELHVARLYLGPPPLAQGAAPQYDHWNGKAPPPHVRLARAPSLREYPQHHSWASPQGIVSEELRSWQQRTQSHEARSRSLDRTGAERAYQPHAAGLQAPKVPQRRILQRSPDGTPVQWFEEEECEIVSQV
ncbi:innate immunity activator protein isoform X2 [Brienomyrus brachyistius]|uniref:innate immunity activator protein isoform X2 n=1 Tax=Brienomyrus brachyistius TaxID=42636 RepID=UPI0020B3E2B8|nr:innate immunity activator protein isoform X2 [Brienomyrus brachyistius]